MPLQGCHCQTWRADALSTCCCCFCCCWRQARWVPWRQSSVVQHGHYGSVVGWRRQCNPWLVCVLWVVVVVSYGVRVERGGDQQARAAVLLRTKQC